MTHKLWATTYTLGLFFAIECQVKSFIKQSEKMYPLNILIETSVFSSSSETLTFFHKDFLTSLILPSHNPLLGLSPHHVSSGPLLVGNGPIYS